RAWILPLAVTFETRSIFSTFAVVTRATSLSFRLMKPMATKPSTRTATTARMIFVLFFISLLRWHGAWNRYFLTAKGVKGSGGPPPLKLRRATSFASAGRACPPKRAARRRRLDLRSAQREGGLVRPGGFEPPTS